MDADRFDQLTRTWGIGTTRRRVLGGMLGAALAGLGARRLGGPTWRRQRRQRHCQRHRRRSGGRRRR